ncbi:hypothetical protein [Verrucomicrobium spinosum]|uniref:hypothetical protein n=1 Tax=Verrucomicrobium spinosum TaxID=2736 RepID=UPI00017452ED|nr:hypothetical protein [Verrucomicrobium spinosum]
MKAILKIGYDAFLLPNIDDATKVVKLMSKAVKAEDRLYKETITLRDDEIKFEVLSVPSKTKFVQLSPGGQEEPVTIPVAGTTKRLSRGSSALRPGNGNRFKL